MILEFKKNEQPLTLGVEMELQVIDCKTLRLTPRAPELLQALEHPQLAKEMFQSTIEIVTGVCNDVHEVRKDLLSVMEVVERKANDLGLCFSGTGTNQVADYKDRLISASPRYHQLLERNQWLIRRMAVYGLHVHIGMEDGDKCIAFNNFFMHFIPHLIALSASSPYWQGQDTGLEACRPTMYEAHPTSGMPYLVNNWQEFNDRYNQLLAVGAIESMKDIWWDLRPSPGYGTLELRICDGTASLFELETIVAFVHCLAHWFHDFPEYFSSENPTIPDQWILRENKWRAIRYGIDAQTVNHWTLAVSPLREQVMKWLDTLKPFYEKLGYMEYYQGAIDICEKGGSSRRQRTIMAENKSLDAVLAHCIKEYDQRRPIWN